MNKRIFNTITQEQSNEVVADYKVLIGDMLKQHKRNLIKFDDMMNRVLGYRDALKAVGYTAHIDWTTQLFFSAVLGTNIKERDEAMKYFTDYKKEA